MCKRYMWNQLCILFFFFWGGGGIGDRQEWWMYKRSVWMVGRRGKECRNGCIGGLVDAWKVGLTDCELCIAEVNEGGRES